MTTTDPVTEHDARCPEMAEPQLAPDPDRCTCRDAEGKTPREPATSWSTGPMCAFDLETTGQDPLTARIVTATVIRIRPNTPTPLNPTNWLSDVDGVRSPRAPPRSTASAPRRPAPRAARTATSSARS